MLPKSTKIHGPTKVMSVFIHCSIPSTSMVLHCGDNQSLNVPTGIFIQSSLSLNVKGTIGGRTKITFWS